MSDAELRQLERAFLDAGSDAAARAYLQALERHELGEESEALRLRVHLGLVSQSSLQLAAYLGHAAAREALPAGEQPEAPGSFKGWAEGLWRWGQIPCVLAGVIASRAGLERKYGDAIPVKLGVALDSLTQWTRCPCREHPSSFEQRSVPKYLYETGEMTHCPPMTRWEDMGGTWGTDCRHHVEALGAAARLSSRDAVRADVEAGLGRLALSGELDAPPPPRWSQREVAALLLLRRIAQAQTRFRERESRYADSFAPLLAAYDLSSPRTLSEDPSHEGYDYAIVLTEAGGFWVSAAPQGPASRWFAVDEAHRLFAADEAQPLSGGTERIDAREVSI